MNELPQALAIGAFFLSSTYARIDVVRVHRSNQNLPPALKSWYLDIHHKMQMQGCALRHLRNSQARSIKSLARLLRTAFEELDKAFTKRWF
nr:DUF412 family protein [uncultured Paraglaciecola sp.]